MKIIPSIKQIFSLFYKVGFRKKRTKILFLFSLIPVVILIIVKIFEIANPHSSLSASHLFYRVALVLYFQMIIGILSVFFGSSIVEEERDSKTIVFLQSKPIPDASVIIGKFMAYVSIIFIMMSSGLILSFLIANINTGLNFKDITEIFKYLFGGLLAILAYTSLFTFISTFFNRGVLIGLFFIFGWENIISYMPGSTQKLSIIHYVKSIIPKASSAKNQVLFFQLQVSSLSSSILTLLGITIVAITLACIIYSNKEYIV